jgi:hypothetical protein
LHLEHLPERGAQGGRHGLRFGACVLHGEAQRLGLGDVRVASLELQTGHLIDSTPDRRVDQPADRGHVVHGRPHVVGDLVSDDAGRHVRTGDPRVAGLQIVTPGLDRQTGRASAPQRSDDRFHLRGVFAGRFGRGGPVRDDREVQPRAIGLDLHHPSAAHKDERHWWGGLGGARRRQSAERAERCHNQVYRLGPGH